MRCCVGLILALPLLAAAAPEEEVGDLLIRYDSRPVPMAGGEMVWKGETRIPLKLKDGKLSGTGSFSYRYDGKVDGCTSACTASSRASVSGTALGDLASLTLAFPRSSASCQVRCPPHGAFASDSPESARQDRITVSLSSELEIPWKPDPEGPTLYYRIEPLCAPQPGAAPATEVAPIPVGVSRLNGLTLDDIRRRPPAKDTRLGFTHHPFDAPLTITDASAKPRRGSGFCYWVKGLAVRLREIQVQIPGISYGADSCQLKTIASHEELHVRSYQALLNDFAKDLRKALDGAPVPWAPRPRKVADAAAARAELQAQLEALLAPISARWVDRRIAADAKLDTAEEYRRTLAQCPRW